MKGKGKVTTYWLLAEKMAADDSSGFTELDHFNTRPSLRENYNFHHRSSRIIDLVNESFDPEMESFPDSKYMDPNHPKLDSGKLSQRNIYDSEKMILGLINHVTSRH